MTKKASATATDDFGEYRDGDTDNKNKIPHKPPVGSTEWQIIYEKAMVAMFWRDRHPWVYDRWLWLARFAVTTRTSFSGQLVAEQARADGLLGFGSESAKLPNELVAAFVRMLIADVPELSGYVSVRPSMFDAEGMPWEKPHPFTPPLFGFEGI